MKSFRKILFCMIMLVGLSGAAMAQKDDPKKPPPKDPPPKVDPQPKNPPPTPRPKKPAAEAVAIARPHEDQTA